MSRHYDDLPSIQAQDRFGNTLLARLHDIFMAQPAAPRMFTLKGRGERGYPTLQSPQQQGNPVMNDSSNAVFQAFIDAKQALDELPAAKAELDRVRAELDTTHHSLDDAELRAMELEDQLKALNTTLAAKEEALAAATFRETDMANKLAVIQSVIGVPVRPEPVVEAGVSQGSSVEPSIDGAQGHSEMDPTRTHSLSDVSATQAYLFDTASDSTTASTRENAGTNDPTPDQRDADPTSGNASQEPHSATFAENTGERVNSGNSALPYYRKPADISWRDWTAAGNEPAPWLGKDFSDHHTIAAK